MGGIFGRELIIEAEELKDAGVSRDENGRINDPKELLKFVLIN